MNMKKKNEIETVKKSGRKSRFTTEFLISIVEKYKSQVNHYGIPSATELAEFAENNLKIDGIKYYHFTRNTQVKEHINNMAVSSEDEKDNKQLGRPGKFSTEFLEKVIDSYFNQNKVFGQISASDIAKYALDKLKIEGIKYYHFTRNEKIKKMISDINNVYSLDEINYSKEVMISFNSDRFLDMYGNDKRALKIQMRHIADRYNDMNYRVIEYQDKILKLEADLNELKSKNKQMKEEIKEVRDRAEHIRKINVELKKYKKFAEKGAMLEYLKGKGLISTLDEENFIGILASCNMMEEKDVYEVSEEYLEEVLPENFLGEENINDNEELELEEFENEDNVLSLENVKKKKNAAKDLIAEMNERLKKD